MKNSGRSRFVASQGGLPVVLYPTDQFPTIASIPAGAVVIANGVAYVNANGTLIISSDLGLISANDWDSVVVYENEIVTYDDLAVIHT